MIFGSAARCIFGGCPYLFTQRTVGCIKKHRGSLFWGCLWFSACFSGGNCGFCEAQEAQYARQQAQIVDMELNLTTLKNDLARVGTDGYVENEAREKLDFIREGEIVFAFENPDALKGYTEEEYQIIMDEMRD
jgi:hypothetical protein